MKRLIILFIAVATLTGFHSSQVFAQARQIRIETAEDGTGTVVPVQNLAAGSSITVYAITRDSLNVFVANVVADSIYLQNVTGGVVLGDLVVAPNRKSAVFTARVSGSAQIKADSGSLPSTSSGTITTVFGTPTKLRVFPQPSATATAGATFLQQPSVRIEDAYGNLVTSDNTTDVTATAVGSGVLQGTTLRKAVGGLAAFTNLAHTVAGTIRIRFTSAPALAPDTSTNIVVSPAAASKVVVTQQPTNTTAGATISPVSVQLRDPFGNNVTTSGVSILLALSGTGTLSGTTSQNTNTSGLASFANLSINLVGSKRLVATSSGLAADSTSAFTISAGIANRLNIQTQPSPTATAGTVFGQQPVVRIEDAFGNLVTTDNTTVVTATREGGSGILQGTTTATASGGLATFSNLAHNVATTITIRFTSVPILTPDTSANIIVSPAAASKVVFGTQPSNAQAGAIITPAVTVQLQDPFSNSVPTNGVNIGLALDSSGVLSGTTTRATSSGLATFNDLSINLSGQKTLTASSTGLTSAVSTIFTIGTNAASRLGISVQPSASATAGVTFTSQPVIRIEDSNGNLITTDNSTVVTATRAAGSGTLQGTTTATASGGIATFSTLRHNVAGTITIQFTSAPALTPITSNNIVVSPATASSVTATAGTPQSTTISTPFATSLQATLTDAFGNPINGTTVTFTAPSSGASGTFTGGLTSTTATTNASGVATASTFTANSIAGGPYTVNATVVGVASPAAFSLTNNAGAAASIATVAGTPQTTVVNTAFATNLQVIVRDASSNPVSGVTVTFNKPGSGASGNFAGGINTAVTNASGVATAAVFTANGTAGAYTVSATVAGVVSGADFSLTNSAGPPASITATAGTPQSALVNAPFATNMQVRVLDAVGNPASGLTVTFTKPATGASGNFAGGVNTATTNATGFATAPVFTANSTAGSYTVSANVSGLMATATFSLTNTAGSASTIIATAGTPQSAQVGTAFSTAFQATVRDTFSNPVQGVLVTFSAPTTGARGTFVGGLSVVTASTNASGIATATTFTANTVAGTYAVSASVSGVTTPATFSLTNTAGAAFTISATAGTPQSTPINTLFPIGLQATVRDEFSNPVNGVVVTLSAPTTGASGTFTGGLTSTTATSGANGIAIAPDFTANSVAGSYSVSASAAGIGTSATYSLTNTPGPATTLTANAGTPQSAQVNTAFSTALQAKVVDAGNNPVSGVSVTFTAPTGAGIATGTFAGGLSSVSATTNGSGLATAPTFRANTKSGAYSVTASVTGIASPATFSLTNTAGAASTIATTVGTPQSAEVGTAFALNMQVIVQDAFTNPVNGVTVTFNAPLTGASGTFAGGVNTATTNASGLATAAVFTANGTAGTYTVSATASGVATPANFTLTNRPGPPASVTATAGTPQSAQVGSAFATNFKAVVRDASSNTVSGVTVTFTAPSSGATGRWGGLATITATTNTNGEATATVFTANTTAGSYSVTGGVTGVATPATYSLTNAPGPAASITATAGTPQSTQISTAFPVNLQVIVKDAFNNAVPNVVVTFTTPASGAGGTFAGGNTATTGPSGTATANVFVANFTAGSYVVNATVSGVATPAPFNLTNTPGDPASITASAGTPQTAMIGTAFATNLQATVRDGANNPVPGVVVTFTAPSSGPSGTFPGGVIATTATTGSNGVATASVFTANSIAGSYNVNATISGGSTPAVFSLTNQEGPPGSITATAGTPQSSTVGTAFATNLRVLVKDAANNPTPNVVVTFTAPASGPSATFAGGANTATTNASGIATAVVLTANSIAGSYQVTASAPSVSTPAIFNLTNTPGSASIITAIAGTPQSAQVGTAFATNLKAKVTDASNNPVSNVTVTFNVPGSGASGSFAGGVNTALTDSAGIATARTLTANLVAGPFTVNASATGVGAPAPFSLTNTSGAAATIVAFAGTPQSTTVGTPFPTNLSAIVRDSQNNPVGGVIVTFSVPPGAGGPRFPGDSISIGRPTNSSGVATAPTLTAGTVAGTLQATASVSGVTTPTSFSLTQNPGSAASVTATAGTPQSAQINTAFSTNLQATVKDGFSNPISGVTVTFTAPATGASGTFLSGSNVYTGQTNASGVLNASTFTANSTAGLYAVNATVSGVTTPAGFSLTNLSAAAASITATQGTPQSAVVNTAFTTPLAVIVRDASNNPVSGATVTFTSPSTGASGKFTGGVRSVNVTTTASGIATAPTFTADTLAGTYNVTASVGGVATPATFALTNAVGAATNLTAVNPNPRSAQVGAPFLVGFAASVRDPFQNPIGGVTVTYTVNPSGGASGTFAGGANTASTNSSGVATPATFTANSVAGCYTITATVVGIPTPLVFQLCNTPGPASSVTLIGGSSTSTPVGAQFPNPFQFSVRDAFNNPVPNTNVTLAPPTTGASASFNPNPAVTNASGIAQTIGTANTIAGPYNVSATVSGVSTPVVLGLTNSPRAPKTMTITQGSPQATQVGTAFATPFQVLVADTFANPIPNLTVTYTAPTTGASGTFPTGTNTIQVQTTVAGLATAPVFTANGSTGLYTVNASVSGIAAPQVFNLTNLTGPAGSIVATQGTPQNAVVRTAFALRFRATVKDAANNPVANEPVTFIAPTTQPTGKFNGTASQIIVNTDVAGVAEAPDFIADSLAGQYVVNATAGQVSSPAVYSLTNTPRAPKTVSATGGTPQSAQVSTAFALPLQTTVRDTFGNPVPNVRVRYSYPTSGPSGTFAGNVDTAITNSSGVATSALFVANPNAGSYSVSGSVQGVAAPANFQLTNIAGQPGNIAVVSGSPQAAQINTVFAARFVVIVKDNINNPVSGVQVTFTPPQTGPSGLFAAGQNTAITGSNGIATAAAFTANSFSGDYVVNASAQGVSAPARFELTNMASSPASVTAVAGTPQSTQVNSPFVTHFKVTVKDAANNPVNGVTVIFRTPSTGASGTFNNNDSTAITNSTGEAEALTFIANAIAGNYSVFALVAGVSTPAEFHLSNTTGSPGRITVVAGGSQQTQVNALFDTLLAAKIVDSSSNPVSGVVVTFTAPASGASGTFTGGLRTVTATTGNDGIATAPAFTANTTAGSYQVSASGAGVATPAVFSLTNRPAALNRFAVETEQGGAVGLQLATIPFNVKISARDAFGNTVSSFVGTVNVTSNGILSSGGGTSPSFVGGSLIRRLIIRKAGANITITAQRTGGSENGSSNQFNVNNPVPTVTSIFPDSGFLMQSLVIAVSGTNFIDSVTTISVGSGITVNGLTVDSSSQLHASITIASNAVVGPRNVIVSNSPPGGGTSQALQFSVELPVPTPPVLAGGPPDGARNQDTLATLWWRSSALAVAYHLQVSTSPSFPSPMFFNDSTLTDTTKSLVLTTNSSTGITYYWRVRARNGTGAGVFTASKSFSTIPSYPLTFVLNTTVPFATKTNPGDYSATEYRILGLPGDASSVRLRDVMTGTHNVDWVAYWDNGASSSNFVAFDGTSTFNFTVGRAFWILRKGALSISRSVQTAVLDAPTRSVSVPLHSGWNLITSPFVTQIPWSAIDTANGLGLDTPWKFEGTFARASSIEAYKGYYFDNTRSLVNLKIPYGSFSTSALTKIAPSTAIRDRWNIGIELEVDGLIDNSAILGVDPAARAGLDSLEYRKPRAIGEVPSVSFARPEWDSEYSSFAVDFRPIFSEAETWTFDVQSPVRKESVLRFSGIAGLPDAFKAYLVDDRQERFVNLMEKPSYKFTSPFGTSQFRIVVGTEDRVREILSTVLPKEFALGKNFPNPFNPTTTIPMALPHAADISVKIYSILGEEVQTVFSGTMEAGRHFLTWDGRNRYGNTVATGMYIVRFTTNVGKAFTGKMLLMK